MFHVKLIYKNEDNVNNFKNINKNIYVIFDYYKQQINQ